MNGRISKLLRLWAAHSKVGNSQIKRAWNNTPRNRRHIIKAQLVMKLWPQPGVVLDLPE